MYMNAACVILKTSRNGRVERRVAIVQEAGKMYVEDMSDTSLFRFFEYIGRNFTNIETEMAKNFVLSRFPGLKTDEVTREIDSWAVQVLGHLLDTFSRLPVFYTYEDAQREARRLTKIHSVENGIVEVDMATSIVMSPPMVVAA